MDYNIINYTDDLEYVRYSLRNVYYKQIGEDYITINIQNENETHYDIIYAEDIKKLKEW